MPEAQPAPSVELHDYLGLTTRPLPARMLVFHGGSGSGKSSQIRLLLDVHPELSGRPVSLCAPGEVPAPGELLVVEEITRRRELLWLAGLGRRYRTVLVASHVPVRWFSPLRLIGSVHAFDLDKRCDKLRNWLDARGVCWTETALEHFVARFNANYTDLEIILESTGCDDLDRALALFLRGGAIRHGPFAASPDD